MCGSQVRLSWNTNHIPSSIQHSIPSRSRSFGLDAPSSWPPDNLRTCCGAKRYRMLRQTTTRQSVGLERLSYRRSTTHSQLGLVQQLPTEAFGGRCVFADILMFTPLCVVSQPQTPMPRDCRSILLARLKRRLGCMRSDKIGYRFGTHCMSTNSYT